MALALRQGCYTQWIHWLRLGTQFESAYVLGEEESFVLLKIGTRSGSEGGGKQMPCRYGQCNRTLDAESVESLLARKSSGQMIAG